MRIDFVRSPRQPVLGWLVLASALATTGLAGWQYLALKHRQEALTKAQQQQAQLLAENERQRLAALPPPLPPYVDDKRWHLAAHELALPWINTLRALEQATKPPIFLVGFKSDPATGRLQLDAEAPSLDAALDFVSALQAAPTLSQTQILSHEESPDSQGRPLTRFSLQTKWVLAP